MERTLPKPAAAVGQTVYLVESCRCVREAVVHARSGGLYTLRFTDSGGGIRVRGDRLHPTRAAAEARLRQQKERQSARPVPCLWHNVPLWQC